jgi:multidrug efflux system outer membrane protein
MNPERLARVTLLIGVLGITLTGCANLAPDYERPVAPVATAWPTPQSNEPGAITADELGWKEFYSDERLRQLITQALDSNRSLRQTALAVESSRSQFQITRASALPTVDAGGGSTAQRSYGQTTHAYSAALGISAFELDFFGRIHNLRGQALEIFLASEETLRAMRITLVAEVATAYLTLAADQQSLRLATSTLASQQKSLDLTLRTFEIGTASGLDVATAQASGDTARADIATFGTQVAQDLNSLTLLVGQPIEPALVTDTGITVTDPLTPLMTMVSPAAELPSELLQRRPDVLAAERILRAANANIGAARAARFPSITLTTSVGTASSQLSQLFSGGSGLWSFAPLVSVPIFDGGSGAANVRVAEVARDSALASYEATIQTAFKEVANALAAQRNMSELLAARQSLLAANEKIYRLTEARYRKGLDSSLSVLTVQRSYYTAQQSMITARLQEASNWVSLYRVLGGGWQQ